LLSLFVYALIAMLDNYCCYMWQKNKIIGGWGPQKTLWRPWNWPMSINLEKLYSL